MFELVDDPVDGCGLVGGRGPGPHEVTVSGERDLAHLAVGDPGVLLLGEDHLGVVHPVEEPPEARHLLLRQPLQPLRDLDLATADDDVHRVATSSVGVREV